MESSMKIGHPADKPVAPPAAGSQPAAAEATKSSPASAGAATPHPADPSAKVALSSTASTLLSGSSGPEFDAAKVASMSASIANGTFKVNPEAIADKLIANAQELLAKVKA
jgi:negative regulator of flagellin synthesis FlgM